MSRPATERGMILVECEAAVLALALIAVGLARLHVTHDRLVQDIAAWTEDGAVLFVDRPDDPLHAIAGVPASLVPDPPLLPVPPAEGDYEVTLLSVERTLDPPTVTVLAQLAEIEP